MSVPDRVKAAEYVLCLIIVPSLALANFVIMVIVANQFITNLPIKNQPHNPWLISGVFAITFILPSLLGRIRTTRKRRKAVIA